jgi:hypothetical protein
MKHTAIIKNAALGMMVLLANATTVWAVDVAREDSSDMFVYIFLGFCALIVVAQLIPAVMMVLGIAKGVKKPTPETVPATANHTAPREG